MIINADTKIASILKQNAAALDAIVSISPKFQKLKNPLLRKVMAGRTSLAAAAKLGGCSMEDLFQKLEPLSFTIDRQTKAAEEKEPVPPFITRLRKEQLVALDVRPLMASGADPLNSIMEKVKTIEPGQALKIITTFEPAPLILLLGKKGFETYVDTINTTLIETYFYKTGSAIAVKKEATQTVDNDFESLIQQFGNRIQKIDVRNLEMPQPMLVILDALDRLPADAALYVYHKRIPVFLLPELAQRGFDYRIKEIKDADVHLLVFKN